MPIRRVVSACLIVCAVMIFCGCASEVLVKERPPAARVEVIEGAPTARHVWIPGHWAWEGHWVWARGHWEIPPGEQTVWVPGHWQETPRGWRWIEGHWRD